MFTEGLRYSANGSRDSRFFHRIDGRELSAVREGWFTLKSNLVRMRLNKFAVVVFGASHS